ncbi:RNA-binding (RRM/RBD/RNP motifs) family protein [Rhynchospora pubera]|uniref:RNA-binding (RRM/RBD/RNP motifs) family protein n=1 Tax=Rhynchospora pubera TaxID=906938 RepID=A0AAV8EC20_9POAL|nr:RNA-binding (RRM/RBD/RNP motifs) family protein [Rhynchospora pubera]
MSLNQHFQVRTVKVSNLSHGASEQDIREFFSFSGEIEHVEMQGVDEWSQIAYVTFKDAQGADTALLLSGATIVDMSVIISAAPEYKPPPSASAPPYTAGPTSKPATSSGAVQKAEDVVSTMLAKGFTVGKDAVSRAKSFDQKHQLTSTASAKVVSLDRKIGLSEKFSMGTSVVNGKVREVDNKFQVSEKTKSALATAKQGASNAGSAIMKNRFVFTGVSWVSSAFNKVAETASDVSNKTKEKMAAEEQHKASHSGSH